VEEVVVLIDGRLAARVGGLVLHRAAGTNFVVVAREVDERYAAVVDGDGDRVLDVALRCCRSTTTCTPR
jgi:hypothetical protein